MLLVRIYVCATTNDLHGSSRWAATCNLPRTAALPRNAAYFALANNNGPHLLSLWGQRPSPARVGIGNHGIGTLFRMGYTLPRACSRQQRVAISPPHPWSKCAQKQLQNAVPSCCWTSEPFPASTDSASGCKERALPSPKVTNRHRCRAVLWDLAFRMVVSQDSC